MDACKDFFSDSGSYEVFIVLLDLLLRTINGLIDKPAGSDSRLLFSLKAKFPSVVKGSSLFRGACFLLERSNDE